MLGGEHMCIEIAGALPVYRAKYRQYSEYVCMLNYPIMYSCTVLPVIITWWRYHINDSANVNFGILDLPL